MLSFVKMILPEPHIRPVLHLVAEQSKLKFWQDEFGTFLSRRRGVKKGGGAFRTGGRGDCVRVDIHLSSKSGEVDITATTMTSHLRDIYGGFDPFWQPLGSVAAVWFGPVSGTKTETLINSLPSSSCTHLHRL